jgi:hypothetical protein
MLRMPDDRSAKLRGSSLEDAVPLEESKRAKMGLVIVPHDSYIYKYLCRLLKRVGSISVRIATGLDGRGSISGSDRISLFSTSSKTGPSSPLSNRYRGGGLALGVKWPGLEATTRLHLVSRSRMVEVYLHSPIYLEDIFVSFFFPLAPTLEHRADFSVSLIIFTDGRTPWMSDQLVPRPLSKHSKTQHRLNTHTKNSCLVWNSSPRSRLLSE